MAENAGMTNHLLFRIDFAPRYDMDLGHGSSTTLMARLCPRLDCGSGGEWPVVVLGIGGAAYGEV
jgi:hypothetical protein